jgi:hypothetical protein
MGYHEYCDMCDNLTLTTGNPTDDFNFLKQAAFKCYDLNGDEKICEVDVVVF